MKQIRDMLAGKADEFEIVSLDGRSSGVGFSNNLLKSTSLRRNTGIALRLIRNGRLAQSSSSNPRTYPRLVERTLELAAEAEPAGFHLPGSSGMADLPLYDDRSEAYLIQDMVAMGHELIEEMRRYDPAVLTFCGDGVDVEEVAVLNSHGVDAKYRRSSFGFWVGGQLVEGNNILMVYETYSGLKPCTNQRELLQGVIRELEIGRRNVPYNERKARVIFTPRAVADILICFQEGINGANIAKGTSPLVGKLGVAMFDPRIVLYDDPLHPDGTNSNPVDDEGTGCGRLDLIKDGRLCKYLLDCRNAAKLGLDSTGNGYRRRALLLTHGYSVGVSPHLSNLVMAPGELSLDALENLLGDGLVVDNITGILLGNLINGDFAGTIGLGYKVVGGRRLGRVKDVMISGNFYRLFAEKLVDFSRDRTWTGALGGSTGSYLLPWVLCRDVDVAVKG
ncbi:TldD/PmbA family protein [bacterium]|nr:TldD/PmbA family protein [candidate division CSSED10-310 bacterium]